MNIERSSSAITGVELVMLRASIEKGSLGPDRHVFTAGNAAEHHAQDEGKNPAN